MKKREFTLLLILLFVVLIVEVTTILCDNKKQISLTIIPAQKQALLVKSGVSQNTSSRPAQNALELEKLDLELVGIMVGNVKDPLAFIKDLRTGNQKIYRLGNTIRDARIVSIKPRQVTLERGGKKEVLALHNRSRSISATGKERLAIMEIAPDTMLVNKTQVLAQAGQLFKAVNAVRVSPYKTRDDAVKGLKVVGITKGSLLEAAGICDNDVVVTINNQKIDSYQKALQVVRKAKNQQEVNVHIIRDGKEKLLRYNLE